MQVWFKGPDTVLVKAITEEDGAFLATLRRGINLDVFYGELDVNRNPVAYDHNKQAVVSVHFSSGSNPVVDFSGSAGASEHPFREEDTLSPETFQRLN